MIQINIVVYNLDVAIALATLLMISARL